MIELEAMEGAMLYRPGLKPDWLPRLAAADWYEENGRPDMAACLRWQVAHKKRPLGNSEWSWYNAAYVCTGTDPESDLPDEVFRALPGVEHDRWNYRKDYATLRQADEALCAALAEVGGL